MATISPSVIAFYLLVILMAASSCEALFGANRDYDGRSPLFGVVASGEEYKSDIDDMDSAHVPDAFVFFVILARWFG